MTSRILSHLLPALLLTVCQLTMHPLQAQSPPVPLNPTVTAPASPAAIDESVSIQFPHPSVVEVLSLYEKLTGKRIIRDSNLAGPELSIMVADPIPKRDAIGLMESSLLLNGYTLIPVDEKTVKILGPSRPPRSESRTRRWRRRCALGPLTSTSPRTMAP